MPELSLHDALAILPADELQEIADRAAGQAEALRAGHDPYSKGWGIVYAYIGSAARYALIQRELELSNV